MDLAGILRGMIALGDCYLVTISMVICSIAAI
jgi:hypothetical protein